MAVSQKFSLSASNLYTKSLPDCRGDGIGTIILKRLEDAEADNDRILGVILETATNHSSNAVSITHPHAPTQEVLFQKVMDDAGLDPHDVSYVEMHGTGTQGEPH